MYVLCVRVSVCPCVGEGVPQSLRHHSRNVGAGSPDCVRRCNVWKERVSQGKYYAQAREKREGWKEGKWSGVGESGILSCTVPFPFSVQLQGTVIVIANHGDRIDIPTGAVLENKIVSGNLRILDH